MKKVYASADQGSQADVLLKVCTYVHVCYIYAPLVSLETTFSTLMPLIFIFCLRSDSKTEPKCTLDLISRLVTSTTPTH